MSRRSSNSVQTQIPMPEPEPIDKQGLLDLLKTRQHFYSELSERFDALISKVDALPPGLQFDVTAEYGGHTVIGYKLTVRL